jgi:hypothetical protein
MIVEAIIFMTRASKLTANPLHSLCNTFVALFKNYHVLVS